MNSEPRPFNEVLEEAKKNMDRLEQLYDVPVLFAVPDPTLDNPDSMTATSASAPRVVPGLLGLPTTSIVVPVQPRNRTSPATKCTFGRAETCDVVLPFAAVSKEHGYFEQKGGQWYVVDVGSTNGITVGGQQTVRDKPLPIANGTVLQFGSLIVRFVTAAAFVAILRQLR